MLNVHVPSRKIVNLSKRETTSIQRFVLVLGVFFEMTLAVSTVGFGRFTITHLTRMVSSTLRSGGNAHSGRIFSIGSLPCMALLPLLPFADLHLNSRKFSSDSFNASSKPGLATPGLLVHQRLVQLFLFAFSFVQPTSKFFPLVHPFYTNHF